MRLEHPISSRRLGGVVASTAAAALLLSGLSASPALAATPTATIAAVQGTTDASPLAGTAQTVEGIVTADYRGVSGYRGIVVQTPGTGGATDATPGASDGIFVFLNNSVTPVVLGDKVTVSGAVSEFRGLTQLGGTAAVPLVIDLITPAAQVAAAELVAPAVLPDTLVGAAREALESQLVTPTGTYRVASSFQLAAGGGSAFGSLFLSAGAEELIKSTETTDAGADANAIAAANRANRLLLDDGYSISTVNEAHPGEQPYFTAETVVRTGDTVQFPATPYVLSYGFDDWRLQPIVPINDQSPAELKATFAPTNPRPTAAPVVGGDFSVGAFNVFNYFTTFADDNPDARGADNAEDFAIQRSKIVAAINGLDADVVALMEIENSIKLGQPVDSALADLVAGLNAAAGAGTWSYVPTPAALATPGAVATTDFITNALIYKTASATPVGESFTQLDESVWFNAREPIAQTFDVDGKVFTAVANHFKSKSGSGAEPADGQGQFNADRVAQANAVLSLTDAIAADPAKGPDVALLGDFNAYSEEDPIQVFTDAGLVDLIADTTDDQYSYEFNGELGSLDHALVTSSLAASVTGAGIWGINSAEWTERSFAFTAPDPTSPFRSSDHDPLKFGVSAAAAPVAIDIVSINDFHGRLEASAPATGGAAVLGGMVDAYEAANPNTLFVSAGDSIGASTFTSFIQQDQPTLDVLNEIGLDVSAFGNHEFDQGAADVDTRVIPNSDFPYLGANIYEKGTQTPAYDEYFVSEQDGVRVGFIGAVTELMPSLVSPDRIADLDFGPIVPAVNRVAAQLNDGDEANGEADVIVLLVHEGAANGDIATATDDSAFGRIVSDVDAEVDAIISAHTHTEYNHSIPVPGTDKVRPVLQSGEYGEAFGHIEMSVDPESGELLSISSERLPLFGAFPPDPEVAQIVADAVAIAAVEGSVKVGDITADFNRAIQTNATENRGGESSLGNFVADVQLWATEDAGSDIALMNPGGLRSDLKFAANPATPGDGTGVVTYSEAAGVQPFANTLFALDLSTEQLKSVLEEQWQPAGSSRPFLKLGASESLEYTYDPTAAQGDRIDAIYVNDELAVAGDSFRVTVNSFLASGGDNFGTLALGTNRTDTGKVDLAAMVDYFEAFPTESPEYEQRSVGVTLSAPDADGYSAGDQVTVGLSSLLFSGSGPAGGTATISLGDTELGSATIDPAIVDTTDEVGRASIVMTVPAGVSGAQVLTVAVAANGTEIAVPIEFAAAQDLPNENVTAPVVTGTARVGSTLTASPGTWTAEGSAFAYQWFRGDAPISGATSATYRLVTADAGASLSVQVAASAAGYADGVATSAATAVVKIRSTVYGSSSRTLVFGNQRVTYSAVVVASGVVPTGNVGIYDGTRRIATGVLDANGRISVTLPRLSSGVHLLSVRYGGNAQVAGDTSPFSAVLVF